MGILRKGTRKATDALTATELADGRVESEPFRLGRRLIFYFYGKEEPFLEKVEFHCNQSATSSGKFGYLKQKADSDKDHNFTWTEMPQALSLLFLGYSLAGMEGRVDRFSIVGGKGSPAATLGYAIDRNTGKIHTLFAEHLSSGAEDSTVPRVFDVRGSDVRAGKQRVIFVKADYLPPDCVEVFWDGVRLQEPGDIRELDSRIRRSLGMPVEPAVPGGKGSLGGKATPASLPESAQPKPATTQQRELLKAEQPKAEPKPPTEPEPSLQTEQGKLSSWLIREIGDTVRALRSQAGAGHSVEKSPFSTGQQHLHKTAKKTNEKVDVAIGRFAVEAKSSAPSKQKRPHLDPAPARIDPSLFEIRNPEQFEWLDSEGLINFGEEDSEADIWRIRDASEGVLIFGAVGSGKTSSSGSLVATQFLNAGYGGLVLTAKPDEARRWLRLCEQTGRIEDCIHVTPHSGHKLNILQYETQRPGERVAIADDLIALFRCLIGVMSRSPESGIKDDFWSNATNALMRNLFEVFLLAGEPLTIRRFVQFINFAPSDQVNPWRGIEYFGDIMTRAESNARKGTQQDKDCFGDALEYWTKTFPRDPDVTRGGYIAGFTTMGSVLNGRGIHEIISTETNFTPEMILSGKIVILDFPIKENVKGGTMIQAAWKLLFQQAIERRADKNQTTARPVFLWEDEGHLSFSQYDVNFQPTARDCRASHVILSQNIHNFLHLGHSKHAVYAVFSAMNTYIFHTNGDHETNCWASERIGDLREKRLRSKGLFRAFANEDVSIFPRRPEENKSVGGFEISEKRERAIPPEDFGKLKRGGDGTCEAVIFWLGHQFAVNKNRNYCVRVFAQEPKYQLP